MELQLNLSLGYTQNAREQGEVSRKPASFQTQQSSCTFLEFFAGSGLVAQGLRGLFRAEWANDICAKKAAVYTANHGTTHSAWLHCQCAWRTTSVGSARVGIVPMPRFVLAGLAEGINAHEAV